MRTDTNATAALRNETEDRCCDRQHSEESPCFDIYATLAPRNGGRPWRDETTGTRTD